MVGAMEVLAAVLLLILGLFSLSPLSFSSHLQSRLCSRALSSKASAGWLGKAVLTGWCRGLGRLETLREIVRLWEGVGTPADGSEVGRSKSLSAVLA